MKNTKTNFILSWGFVAIVATGLLFFLIKGHTPFQGWGGDYAGYINQARFIVEGKDLIKDATYIYNPDIPHLAPPAYPMGYSLFLAPVYAIWGLDTDVFSIVNCITLWLFGVGTFIFLRPRFGMWVALGAALFICLNPYLYQYKGFVLPDYLFAFFELIALCVYAFYPKNKWQNALLCGLMAGLAWLTRVNGVLIVGIVVLDMLFQQGYETIRARQWTMPDKKTLQYGLVFVLVAVGVPVLVQQVIWPLPKGGSYFDQLHFNADFWKNTGENALEMFKTIQKYFRLEHQMPFMQKTLLNEPYTYIMQTGPVLLAVGGALGVLMMRDRAERFLLLYLLAFGAVLSIWPMVQGIRYTAPVLPVVLYFVLKGLKTLDTRFAWLNGLKWAAAFGLFIPAFYHINKQVYAVLDQEEIGSPQYRLHTEAFEWVKQNTPKEAIFAAHHPLIFGLYTDRKSFKWRRRSPDEIMAEWQHFKAEYVVINLWELDTDHSLQEFMKKYEAGMTKLWANERNVVYKINAPAPQ
jgi:hypothetical protein